LASAHNQHRSWCSEKLNRQRKQKILSIVKP
jgi:hypothetical protein